MGRPKRCPIQIERTKTLCRSLCYEQGIACNAYRFEATFEPTEYKKRTDDTIQRKQKFYRLFKGKHTISESTLTQISKMENTKSSVALYKSSLWQSLVPSIWDYADKPRTRTKGLKEAAKFQKDREEYWLKFFSSLSPSLQKIALKCDAEGQSIKGVNHNTAEQLLKHGDIEALACAIAIHRASPHHLWAYELSSTITKLCGWVFSNPSFIDSVELIYDLLTNKYSAIDPIVNIYDKSFCKKDDWGQCFYIFDYIAKNNEYIRRCSSIGLKITPKSLKQIFALSEKGNKQLIFEEMGRYLNKEEYILSTEDHGLLWLISALNKNQRNKASIKNLNT